MLPAAQSSVTFQYVGEERFEIVAPADADDADATVAAPAEGALVYAGYDEQGRLIGLAIEAQGMGYQDVIRVLYGYSFADDAIVGIQVLVVRQVVAAVFFDGREQGVHRKIIGKQVVPFPVFHKAVMGSIVHQYGQGVHSRPYDYYGYWIKPYD